MSATNTSGSAIGTGSTSASSIVMTSATATGKVGNATGENICARIRFSNPEGSDFMEIDFAGNYSAAGAFHVSFNGGGRYNTAGSFTGIRLMFSSGNISSGRASLYGLKKA